MSQHNIRDEQERKEINDLAKGLSEKYGYLDYKVAGYIKITERISAKSPAKAWNRFKQIHPDAKDAEINGEDIVAFCEGCEAAIPDMCTFHLDDQGCYFCPDCMDSLAQRKDWK